MKPHALVMTALVTLLPARPGAHAAEQRGTIPLSAHQLQVAHLAPDVPEARMEFPLDAAGSIRLELIASVGGLDTSILTPSGKVISPGNVESLGGQFVRVEGAEATPGALPIPGLGPGFRAIYTLPSQGAGTYTLRVRAPTPPGELVALLGQVTTDGPLRSGLLVGETRLPLGRAQVLTVALLDGAAPVKGAQVSAVIVSDAEVMTEVALRDDGREGDGAPGDGLYGGRFTPEAAGEYAVEARIEGKRAGGAAFVQQAGAHFSVFAPAGKLTGTFRDRGIDANGDGLFEGITIDVPAQVGRAGSYRVFLHLTTKSGRGLRGTATSELQPGTRELQVRFDAPALLALPEEGPYLVSRVELHSLDAQEGARLQDALEDVGSTQPYTRAQFQRPPLAVVGVLLDQGLDTNGNGRFDRLQVTVGVEAQNPGHHEWSARLTDGARRELGFATGSGSLVAGHNPLRLDFDGLRLGNHHADGPYHVRDLLLFGPQGSLVAEEVGRTQPYRFVQFEHTNLPPVAEAGEARDVECAQGGGTVVLDGRASQDPDGDALTYAWRDASGQVVGTEAVVELRLGLGAHTLMLTVSDGNGGTASDTVTHTVRDTRPPTLALSLRPETLWPPNHRFIPIQARVETGDTCDASPRVTLVSISSNEPGGQQVRDALLGTDDRSFQLLSERKGGGRGRVYTIQYEAQDAAGNKASATGYVRVPHNASPPRRD